jgi:universal stress protein E
VPAGQVCGTITASTYHRAIRGAVMMESPAVHATVKSLSGLCVLFAITSPHGFSRSSLYKAARLACNLGMTLELFCCYFDSDMDHSIRLSSRYVEDVRERVEQQQRQLWALAEDLRDTGVNVRARVECDRPVYEGIVREALRQQAALVIIESVHKTPSERLLFSQTDAKLIETCPCPLLIIRRTRAYETHPRILAAVDPMHAHAKPAILDHAIVAAASDISTALSGELHLFHARIPWAKASHQVRGPRWVPDVVTDENQVAYEQDVESRMAELALRHHLPSLRTHLIDGDVAECLCSFTRCDSIDIVAMGALSRSIVQRVLIGNTARRLFDELDCDVLIVKQPAFHTTVRLSGS